MGAGCWPCWMRSAGPRTTGDTQKISGTWTQVKLFARTWTSAPRAPSSPPCSVSAWLSMLLRPGRSRVVTLYSVFALTVAGYYLAFFFAAIFPRGSPGGCPESPSAWSPRWCRARPSPSSWSSWASPRAPTCSAESGLALLSSVFGLAVAVTPLVEKSWARMGRRRAGCSWPLTSVSLLLNRARSLESDASGCGSCTWPCAPGPPYLAALDAESAALRHPMPSLGVT